MTTKERRFEQFVNYMQARQDELSEFKEWRRLKDVEEEAISLYHEVGKNMEQFARQMRTRDQMEMEYQCQRKRQKAEDLNPQKALMFPMEMDLNRQDNIRAQQVEDRAREQERIKGEAVASFKAGIQASGGPVANTKIITDAAGSQRASRQFALTRAAPEDHLNTSKPVSSTEAGSSRQHEQQQQQTLSAEEIPRQSQEETRLSSATTTAPTLQPASPKIPPPALGIRTTTLQCPDAPPETQTAASTAQPCPSPSPHPTSTDASSAPLSSHSSPPDTRPATPPRTTGTRAHRAARGGGAELKIDNEDLRRRLEVVAEGGVGRGDGVDRMGELRVGAVGRGWLERVRARAWAWAETREGLRARLGEMVAGG